MHITEYLYFVFFNNKDQLRKTGDQHLITKFTSNIMKQI